MAEPTCNSLETSERREHQLRNASLRCGMFINSDQSGEGGANPGLVVLGSIRRGAEQAMGSKPVGSILHGLCINSCLQDPALQ